MIYIIIILVLALAVLLYIQHPKFGRLPSGKRLQKIRESANYYKSEFQNLSPTPALAEEASYRKVFYEFFFKKNKRSKPAAILPSIKTDLHTLNNDENVLVWFGHSSYFLQADGKRFLVDPVFSGSASPIEATTRAFKGSDIYTAEDIPEIDCLFITHDHWDHLDYETVVKLKPKIKKIITGLGTGAHLERWGFDAAVISELDWQDSVTISEGFVVHIMPARHFSGRWLKRNGTLWVSVVLKTPSFNLYLGGDSGYDSHFKTIGETFGPFDLAILECGQYNEYWKYIHMMPEETVQAATDLKAQRLLPVHWAKFSLALHAWDEPVKRVTAEAEKKQIPLLTPMIGEKVKLDNTQQEFSHWWEIM
ncbi:MBL fold metallo-hydrolase [Flavobacterium sp. MK4S-17]|uniref:MBL fold metallo-hydrolase n=1 Tax=Flavobacterium sp. MK4S-17 TaxID=2543737 RepID=UPI00135C62B6|nr:MBL fold metallo-hydrolase [Flavobacterium sp. MK4S-17]